MTPAVSHIRRQRRKSAIRPAGADRWCQGLLFYSYTDLFYKRKTGRFDQREFDATARCGCRIAANRRFHPLSADGKIDAAGGSDPQMPARMFILGVAPCCW